MRLLVVEDEEGLVSALRSGLGRAGYAVDAATTGAEAMEKLATTAYDLAILDITLPDTSGLHSEPGVGSTFVLWLPERSLTNTTHRAPTPPPEDPLGPRA
ncbi:response regulator [Kribbella sp. CWNU-51]